MSFVRSLSEAITPPCDLCPDVHLSCFSSLAVRADCASSCSTVPPTNKANLLSGECVCACECVKERERERESEAPFVLLSDISLPPLSPFPPSLPHGRPPPACNPNTCRASGRVLQPKGVRVKEVADFKVHTKGAGSGELKVTVKGPSEYRQAPHRYRVSSFTGLRHCLFTKVPRGKFDKHQQFDL